jgi:hypothetical protein
LIFGGLAVGEWLCLFFVQCTIFEGKLSVKKTIWRALAERSRHWLGAGLLTLAATLVAMPAQAGVGNGNFEAGDCTGWSVESLRNNGITTFLPATSADLGLVAGTATDTTVRGTPAFNAAPLAAGVLRSCCAGARR